MRHPHAGADKVDAILLHLREIALPDPGVARTGEIPPIILGAEIVGADGEEGLAVAGEEISLNAEGRAGGEQVLVFDPQSVLVELSRLAGIFIEVADGVEARRKRGV